MKIFLSAAAFLIASAFGPAAAEDVMAGSLMLHQPWARASIGQAKAGAAYLTIANKGEETDRLIAAETPAAKVAQLHTHLMKDGVMKMRKVEAVEIAPGEPVVFRPGGLHIMMMGLKAPLREGESFPVTLIFEKAGRVEISVTVEAPTALEPAMTGDHVHGS